MYLPRSAHCFSSLPLLYANFYFYLSWKKTLAKLMQQSQATGKPEHHCLVFSRWPVGEPWLVFTATLPYFYKGKYGVLSPLDVCVQPVTEWARAQPQHLNKDLPVLAFDGKKRGKFFALVSLILKECSILSLTAARNPKYISLWSSRSCKEQHVWWHMFHCVYKTKPKSWCWLIDNTSGSTDRVGWIFEGNVEQGE